MTRMKLFRFSFLILASALCASFSFQKGPRKLPIIKSVLLPNVDTRTFQNGGEEIPQPWCTMTPAIGGNLRESSFLEPKGEVSYNMDMATDCDIYTAWIEGKDDNGIGEYLEFEINPAYIKDDVLFIFNGKCEMQNGFAESDSTWKANGRVKSFTVYHNAKAICIFELKDSQKIQAFDLSRFFDLSEMDYFAFNSPTEGEAIPIKGSAAEGYNKNKWNAGAPIKLKTGDVLRFEILEVFQGSKTKNTAITELRGGTCYTR
jgi:hypothetical protein